MAEITSALVKELRDMTGAGMMDCKSALTEAAGDMEKAIDVLRKKGLKSASKRADRDASEGLIYSYIHPNSRVGVLLELNCETDFVARGEDFGGLAKRLAMHIAWANPRFVDREQVTEDVMARETEIYRSQLTPQQEKVADKIIAGKIEKFFEESCLVDQIDAQESSGKKRMGDYVTETSAKLGEKIVVRRFVRFELGSASK